MKDRYTKADKHCPHCGGAITGNCCGFKIIFWCEKCGSNNPKVPPFVDIVMTDSEQSDKE